MAQRVAIARALARRPTVLALDEPFSALDYFTRLALQNHLLELWSVERFTVLLVTHDVEEAAQLSDRVLALAGRPARIQREIAISSPRPRRRATPELEAAKEEILAAIGGG
jgi:sulfonate transport system ATP-binding protein